MPRERVVAERLAGGQRIDALLNGNGEFGELVADGKHDVASSMNWVGLGILARGD